MVTKGHVVALAKCAHLLFNLDILRVDIAAWTGSRDQTQSGREVKRKGARPYRTIRDFRKDSPVCFHYAMSLWVITVGAVPEVVLKQMRYFDSIFILYDRPFHPTLHNSTERPASRDTPVDPEGLSRFTRPMEAPKSNSSATRIMEAIFPRAAIVSVSHTHR